MNEADTYEIMKKFNITSDAGNELSQPFPFNLMFQTSIGPSA